MSTPTDPSTWPEAQQRVEVKNDIGTNLGRGVVVSYAPAAVGVQMDDGASLVVPVTQVTVEDASEEESAEAKAATALGGGAKGRALLAALRAAGLEVAVKRRQSIRDEIEDRLEHLRP